MKNIILTIFVILAVTTVLCSCSLATNHDLQNDICSKLTSCSSCLSKSYCSWRITKSKCTKQYFGNENVIYPRRIKALMSGPELCPRIVRPEEELIVPSGKQQTFVVKLTQIHLYMAFTAWKCKINYNDEETIVNALLVVDEVYCDPVVLSNKSDEPMEGIATVLWDNNKSFDGSLLFKVSL